MTFTKISMLIIVGMALGALAIAAIIMLTNYVVSLVGWRFAGLATFATLAIVTLIIGFIADLIMKFKKG